MWTLTSNFSNKQSQRRIIFYESLNHMFILLFSLTTCTADVDKARKLGLDEFVQANPSKFMHAELFRTLQKLTLDYRLNDIYTCLVCASFRSFFLYQTSQFRVLFWFVLSFLLSISRFYDHHDKRKLHPVDLLEHTPCTLSQGQGSGSKRCHRNE